MNGAKIKTSLGILAIAILIFFVGIAPFAIRNAVKNRSLQIKNVLLNYSPDFGFEERDSPEVEIIDIEAEKNNDRELNRYFGFRKSWLGNLVSLPFTVTFNSAIRGQYVDVSFVYLALIPLTIIFLVKKKNIYYGKFWLIYLGFAIIWIFWSIAARGIIWYGILGFLFTSLLLGKLLNQLKILSKTLFFLSATIIGFAVLLCLVFRMVSPAYLADVRQIEYIGGEKSESEFFDLLYPARLELEALNNRIEDAKENEANKIYVVGKYCRYFIDNNDELVLQDQFITFGKFFLPNKDPNAVIASFKKEGFKYIVVSNVSGMIFDSKLLSDINKIGRDYVLNNPDKIKILNPDSFSGIVIVEIL